MIHHVPHKTDLDLCGVLSFIHSTICSKKALVISFTSLGPTASNFSHILSAQHMTSQDRSSFIIHSSIVNDQYINNCNNCNGWSMIINDPGMKLFERKKITLLLIELMIEMKTHVIYKYAQTYTGKWPQTNIDIHVNKQIRWMDGWMDRLDWIRLEKIRVD